MIVDRDATPEVPSRFGVFAYPSLLVLGHEDENVLRFRGMHSTSYLLNQFTEASQRFESLDAGKEWLPRPTLASSMVDGAKSLGLFPGSSPKAMTVDRVFPEIDGKHALWCLDREGTFAIDPLTLEPQGKLDPLPGLRNGITFFGGVIHYLPYGWTKGDAILRQPEFHETTELITQANTDARVSAAFGIAALENSLYIIHRRNQLTRISPRSGDIEENWTLRWDGMEITGLADATAITVEGEPRLAILVRARPRPQSVELSYDLESHSAILEFDPASGETTATWSLERPASALAWDRGDYLIADGQIRDYDEQHQPRMTPEHPLIHRWTRPKN